MFLVFASSEVLAKKIVLDCVGNQSFWPTKNEWDDSTIGKKQKLIIDTSKETINFGSLYDQNYEVKDDTISAETTNDGGMYWGIMVDQSGTAHETWWMNKTLILHTSYSCEEGKSLW